MHYAVTYGANQSALYVNGEQVASLPDDARSPRDLGDTTRNYLGRSHYNDPLFKGKMENFRIYGRVLTGDEIADVMDEPGDMELQAALDAIDLGKLLDVREDLDLPADNGGDIAFTWTSSNEDVIGSDGKLYPIAAGREQVTLTATAERDGATASREFVATVLYREENAVIDQADVMLSYNFNAAGVVKDASGNGLDGAINGDVAVENGVASLAGGSIDLPALDLSGVDAMTVTAWVKREDAGKNNARLFDIGVKDVYFNLMFPSETSALMEIRPQSDSSSIRSVSAELPGYGEWVHIAAVYGDGATALYVNGELAAENLDCTYTPSLFADTSNSSIGRSQYAGDPFYDPNFKGQVENFNIYTAALTPGQVETAMKAKNQTEGGADNTAIDDADTIAAYDFANAEDGVIADVSGHGNDAKINGEVAVNAGIAELTGGYISLPGFDFTGLDGVTVSAWMKREDAGKANSRLFDIGVKDIYFNLMFPSETSALVEIRSQSSDSSIRKVNAAVPGYGEWVHVAVTIGSGKNAIYVNGVKAGENTSCTYTPSMFTNTSNSSIGRSQYAGAPFYDPNFKGQIENFRIYNRVLTAEEIAAVKEENNQIGSGTVLATLKAALDGIAIENLDDVTADLALPAASGDVQFSWQSSNPAVIGHDGKFTPIEAGVEDVTLTVTASLDGVVLTREFTASVYHHTPGEIINPKYLIASYNFDEADGGTVKDSSGHGRDGRIDGAVELVNGVAMFGGGYIQLPDGITDYDAMTVSGWLRVKTIQKNARFFDFGTGQNNYYSFQMLSNDGNADIEIKPQGSFNRVRAQSFPYEGEWVHVVSTYSKGSNVLYFNGVEVGRNDSIQSSPSDMGKTTQNYIGKSQFADPNLRGLVENFKLYSKALTPEEVQLVMAEENQTAGGETIQKLYDAVDSIDLGDLSDVTGDLALPAAINGVNFTWKSSKPDVIADNGDRNPDGEGRHEVVLTVTASEGGVTYSRDFIATVIYYTDEEIVNFDKDNLGVVTLVDVDKVYLPTTGKKGSTITWSSSNPAVIATDGAVNRPASGAGAAYVDLTATIQYGDATVTKEFPQRMVMEQYTAYLLTYFGGDELMTNDEPTYATVHFAYSYDGMHWVPLNDNKTIVAATLKGRDNPEYGQDRADVSLARDPVTYRQQDGKLRLLSSHSWNNHDIYVWDAGDLTSFSGERILSVNTDKGNAWAPEVVYDPVKEKYMIIFTDPNMGDSSCGYGTYTTNFTQADVDANKELGLTNIPLMDLSKQGRRYIDCSMHYYNGSYYMPVRYWAGDATHNGVTLAKSDSLEADSFTILPNYSGLEIDESVGDGNNEGPFLIKDFSRERWYLYYDYPDCGSGEEWGMFGLSYTDDLDSGIWHRVPFDGYAMPYGVRHGNATPITQGELDKLIERWGTPEELDVAQLTSPEVEAVAGTPFEQLDLPETVDVILLDGTTKAMPVTWSPENYKEEAGRYKIYGTFGSVEGVSNSKDLRPFVIVKTGGSTGSGLVVDVGFDTLDGKTAVDNSGYGNAMNFVGDLELVDGVNGKAVRFDGSQYANMSKELLMNLYDITISTWLKIDELQTWARAFDFGKGQANFINFIPRADDGNMRVEVRVYNENRSIRPGVPFPTGEWTHVAITMEPETQTGVLYLNGVEIGRSENFYYGPEHLGMSKLNQIGKSKFSDPIFQGAMDEFKMFDRALTAEQVLALYEGRPIDPEEPSDVDKTALKALIAAIDGKYEETRYTAESWKALTDALNAAKAVVADPNATAEELKSAADKLTDAVKNLVKKSSSSGSVSKVSDSDYWNEIIEKINNTAKGGTVNATLESGAMMPATVIDALKGKDATLVVTVGGKDYAINGAGKLTGYTASAVYYTSDEIIAMATDKAPAAGDAAGNGNGNANPETGGAAGAAVASTIGGAAAPASEAPAVIAPEAPAEAAETGTNSDSLWMIAAVLAAVLVSGAGVAVAYRKHKG